MDDGVDRATSAAIFDDRATSPVVGKALEVGIVVLYVCLLSTTLYGTTVPEYRSTAGEEVAERTLASIATDIDGAVPPESVRGEIVLEVDLPATIAGSSYRIDVARDELRLVHPNPDVSTTVALALPERVERVSGTLTGGAPAKIRISTTGGDVEVTVA